MVMLTVMRSCGCIENVVLALVVWKRAPASGVLQDMSAGKLAISVFSYITIRGLQALNCKL